MGKEQGGCVRGLECLSQEVTDVSKGVKPRCRSKKMAASDDSPILTFNNRCNKERVMSKEASRAAAAAKRMQNKISSSGDITRGCMKQPSKFKAEWVGGNHKQGYTHMHNTHLCRALRAPAAPVPAACWRGTTGAPGAERAKEMVGCLCGLVAACTRGTCNKGSAQVCACVCMCDCVCTHAKRWLPGHGSPFGTWVYQGACV
eukprot:1160168-Pelagomonas_calceolata.AAC.2